MKQKSTTPSNKANIPVHFLDVLAEHVSDTLNAALEKINAPVEVKAMAASLYDIVTCLYQDGQADQEFLQQAIAKAALSVEAAGGVWYAPSGESSRRENTLLSK